MILFALDRLKKCLIGICTKNGRKRKFLAGTFLDQFVEVELCLASFFSSKMFLPNIGMEFGYVFANDLLLFLSKTDGDVKYKIF